MLIDSRQRYALWPAHAELPAKSRVVFGEAARDHCLDYLEHHPGQEPAHRPGTAPTDSAAPAHSPHSIDAEG